MRISNDLDRCSMFFWLWREIQQLTAKSTHLQFISTYGSVSKPWYPCSSHQNSLDLWMFIPLKMVLIGIHPYPYFDYFDLKITQIPPGSGSFKGDCVPKNSHVDVIPQHPIETSAALSFRVSVFLCASWEWKDVAVNGEDGVVVLVDQLLIPGSSGSQNTDQVLVTFFIILPCRNLHFLRPTSFFKPISSFFFVFP